MTVRLRMFAAAREAAGRAADDFDEREVGTVEQLLGAATARYGDAVAAVLQRARVWVNGDDPVSGSATALVDGDEVAVLPPVSGG